MERTLLLVDDDENITSALVRLLRRDGYTILRASSAQEGIALLGQHKVGVIISDQRMPGMTGTEFLSSVKELYPDTVRIVLSGYTELNSVTDAINRGAVYKFLTKPWDDDLLRANVEEAFQRYEIKMENARLTHDLQQANANLKRANYALEQRVEWKGREIINNLEVLRVSQEILEILPVAVIGIDQDGLIVIANQTTHHFFSSDGTKPALLGGAANRIIPSDLLDWMASRVPRQQADTKTFFVAGREVRCWVRSLGEFSRSQGMLLVMDPNLTTNSLSDRQSENSNVG